MSDETGMHNGLTFPHSRYHAALQAIERTRHGQTTSVEHMRVDHRGGRIGVPKQFLHSANVLTTLQQVRREAVAQGMATGLLIESRSAGRRGHRLLNGALMQMMPAHLVAARVYRDAATGENKLPAKLPGSIRILRCQCIGGESFRRNRRPDPADAEPFSRSLHLFGWLEFSCTLDVLQHLKCVVQSSLGGAIYCFEMHDLLRKTSCPKDETWPWGQEPALRVAPGL